MSGYSLVAAPYLLLLIVGCAGRLPPEDRVCQLFHSGRLTETTAFLESTLAKRRLDAEPRQLDTAIVQLVSGQPLLAERTLRSVRSQLTERESASLADTARRLVDDAAGGEFRGEEHEILMLDGLLVLANLLHDGGDAYAYSLQLQTRQREELALPADASAGTPPEADPRRRFPLGPYLHAALSETTPLNYDDADRGWAQVVQWQPAAAPALPHWQQTQRAIHSQPGHGVLYVFALVGPGPRSVSVVEAPSTAALVVAEQLLRHVGGAKLPPTIRPVEISEFRATDHGLQAIRVQVNGQPAGQTAVISDIGQQAAAASAASRDRRLAEAVVRRTLKKGTVHTASEALQAQGALQLALLVAGAAWEATEQADTRHWALLPDEVQALRLELPAGTHHVGLRAATGLSSSSTSTPQATQTVEIGDGGNTYLLACFPSSQMVGNIVAYRP